MMTANMKPQVSAAIYLICALEGIKSIQERHEDDYQLCEELDSINIALKNVKVFVEKQDATT